MYKLNGRCVEVKEKDDRVCRRGEKESEEREKAEENDIIASERLELRGKREETTARDKRTTRLGRTFTSSRRRRRRRGWTHGGGDIGRTFRLDAFLAQVLVMINSPLFTV